MNIRHHPDDGTLLAYGAGSVNEGFSLVIAAHLESCGQCRKRVRETEAIGGSLLGSLDDAPLAAGSFEALWARISGEPVVPAREAAPPAPARGGALPGVLAELLPGGFDEIRWRTVAPGIKQHVLKGLDCDNGTLRLLSIAPGTTIPHHGHGGSEITLVLRGSFMDELGRFQAGDVADLDDSVEHQPVADTSEHCICLVATDERLRFTDRLSRMLQPFIGI